MDLLTEREKAVLLLIARGRTNKEISDDLGISTATVAFRVANCLRKLGASSRSEAVAIAMRDGHIRA